MRIILEEQGLRDGIQNLDIVLSTDQKLRFIDRLIDAGIKRLQIASFVHPKIVPQMADAEALIQQLTPIEGVQYSGLVLNVKGVERAIDSGIRNVACSISSSNTHSEKNTGMDLITAQAQSLQMIEMAQREDIHVRAGLQCVFGCRYEGKISEAVVLDMIDKYIGAGVQELSLADSTGMANPSQLHDLAAQVIEKAEGIPVILHLHNTEGKGMANVVAGIRAGVRIFDTAVGGLGGCPFIENASGNIATEDTAHMLHQIGYDTGLDVKKMSMIAQDMEAIIGEPLQGKMYKLLNNDSLRVI